MFATLIKLLNNEDGATAIEYGLIAALIAVAAISAFQLVGTSLTSTFNNVGPATGAAQRGGPRKQPPHENLNVYDTGCVMEERGRGDRDRIRPDRRLDR